MRVTHKFELRFMPFEVKPRWESLADEPSDACARALRHVRVLAQTTFTMGLLYLLIALWFLSIFGNYGDIEKWQQVKQIELFHWSIVFALAAGAAIWHGLRFDNIVSHAFGITFLFINIYTRFFEYFWNELHKAIFFAILGVSLWFLGTRAQTIWNLGRAKELSDRQP